MVRQPSVPELDLTKDIKEEEIEKVMLINELKEMEKQGNDAFTSMLPEGPAVTPENAFSLINNGMTISQMQAHLTKPKEDK